VPLLWTVSRDCSSTHAASASASVRLAGNHQNYDHLPPRMIFAHHHGSGWCVYLCLCTFLKKLCVVCVHAPDPQASS
jgi:hypothetical protein